MKIQSPIKTFMTYLMMITIVGCGGLAADTDNTETGGTSNTALSSEQAGQAIAALFSNQGVGAALVKATLAVTDEDGCGVDDPNCTCEETLDGDTTNAHNIQMDPYPQPTHIQDTYGAGDIAHDSSIFCVNPETDLENTGQGPDGRGRLAAFELTIDVDFDCATTDPETGDITTTTISMGAGSHGIWRNTSAVIDDEDNEITPAYAPEVYGNFTFSANGEPLGNFDCTILVSEGEVFLSATCIDENSTEIVADFSDVECSVNE